VPRVIGATPMPTETSETARLRVLLEQAGGWSQLQRREEAPRDADHHALPDLEPMSEVERLAMSGRGRQQVADQENGECADAMLKGAQPKRTPMSRKGRRSSTWR